MSCATEADIKNLSGYERVIVDKRVAEISRILKKYSK